MMSKCILPNWNLSHQRQDQAEAEEGINRSSHAESLHIPSYIVPMSNYGVMEQKWESGPSTMHGLREISFNTPSMKPTWDKTSDHSLESITHQSTCHNQNMQMPSGPAGLLKKRLRSESNKSGRCFGCTNIQDEHADHSSTCASASTTTWPSQEPLRSVKTKSTDEDLACHGGTENKNGENRTTKEETVRSQPTRGSRAAAIHNQSERRRRDRINQKMKALQKLVPNASKTDKASMLDEVIAYLKHLQAQLVHLMSARRSMPQTIMMPPGILHHLHMSSIPPAGAVTAAAFGPPPFVVPQGIQAWPAPQSNTDAAFLAQSINMDLYNKMAALFREQANQSVQTSSAFPQTNLVQRK